MTLEELLDDVTVAATLDYPDTVSASISIHRLDHELLIEFVDAHPELVQSKSLNYDGLRVVRLKRADGHKHAVTLFSTTPSPGTW